MPAAQLTYASSTDSRGRRLLIRGIERLTGGPELQRLYESLDDIDGRHLWQAALDRLDITIETDGFPIEQIPREGPLVLLGNHPFGVVDGLILCALTARLRQDFKVMTNSVLCLDERVNEHLLPIDFAETREAMRTNVSTKKLAIEALSAGQAVALFPSGGVATSRTAFGRAEDLEWKTFVAKLVRSSQAAVVPLYFHGENGRLFQMASQVSMTLRLSLLLREVGKKRGQCVRVSIGQPIHYPEIAEVKGREALTEYLKRSVMALSDSEAAPVPA